MKMLVLFIAAASLLAVSAPSYAAAPSKIFVKDKQIQSDIQPVIDNGRTLVPLRVMADSIGVTVSWDQKSRSATLRKWSETVTLTSGKNTAKLTKAGQTSNMAIDASVKIINNRVFVPLRFLSQVYGYTVSASGDSVFVNSPLSKADQETVHHGDLVKARQLAMDKGAKSAHYANNPIPYVREIEGFQTMYLFPVGEANRFFLISDNTVSFYELKDDFFVITWQAHVPVGQKDTVQLFLENKITNAKGIKPDIKKDYFFYRVSGLATSTNITAGKISPDGTVTQTGVKRIVGNEVTEQTGTLQLMLPQETRSEENP